MGRGAGRGGHPTLDMICLSILLLLLPPPPQLISCLLRLGIARHVPRMPRRSKRKGRNERRKIKVIVGLQNRLLSEFSSSPTPSPLPAEPDFHLSSDLPPHSDKRPHDHDTSATTPTPSPSDCDLTTSSLCASVHPIHRQLLRIPSRLKTRFLSVPLM